MYVSVRMRTYQIINLHTKEINDRVVLGSGLSLSCLPRIFQQSIGDTAHVNIQLTNDAMDGSGKFYHYRESKSHKQGESVKKCWFEVADRLERFGYCGVLPTKGTKIMRKGGNSNGI